MLPRDRLQFGSRVILRTLDGRVIVRPEAKYPSDVAYLDEDTFLSLNERGVAAWNAGEPLDRTHGLLISRRIAMATF